MRISDWSSDVCSFDLHRSASSRNRLRSWASIMPNWSSGLWRRHYERGDDQARRRDQAQAEKWRPDPEAPLTHRSFAGRSEEHTSELQSLMRISYAVFCLKKTTTQNHHNDHTHKRET